MKEITKTNQQKDIKISFILLIKKNKQYFQIGRKYNSHNIFSSSMSEQPQFISPPPSSPRIEKNTRSKSRLFRQTKPIYLTDGQLSSDHTNISSSEKTILKLEYETKIRKLQKQNHQLRQLVVSLKASQYYELDEEKIRSIIRENDSLKNRISQLESDMKLLDDQLSRTLVENEYLKRNNLAIKQDLEKLIKQSVREKHNYFALPSKKSIYISNSHLNDESESVEQRNQLREKQATQKIDKLMEKKKLIDGEIQREKEKMFLHDSKQKHKSIIVENQESIESIQEKSKKLLIKQRSSKSRYRSSSKSGQKLLLNSIISSKGLAKRTTHKKQPSENIISTAQSASCQQSRHHNKPPTHHLRTQQKSRQPVLLTSRSPNPYESSGSGTQYARRKNQFGLGADYNEEYYLSKREHGIKKKKPIYYI